MDDPERISPVCSSLTSREQRLLRRLANSYCGTYFIEVLEGFVHNLNGPLQILWTRSEQLQQDIGKLQEKLEGADTQVMPLVSRMQERTKSLLNGLDKLHIGLGLLSKDIFDKGCSEVGEVRINDAIQDVFSLLEANVFFKHRVKKDLQLDDTLPSIRGRHTDFCVVMLCLIQNALEAMADTEIKCISVETSQDKHGILVNVHDTGCGISQEICPHIFEPFFTTKNETDSKREIEKHVGLGLTLVSLFLDDYQGNVTFETLPNNTTFTVQLPYRPNVM